MIRRIIHIDESKCSGCGLCAQACHEGAIAMVDGKARLLREDFCDGFGDCLPGCPAGAISFEDREAPEYDKNAVRQAKEQRILEELDRMRGTGGCPGSQMLEFDRMEAAVSAARGRSVSRLGQWPCQIRLLPARAAFFDGAELLIAADCTAYAYANIHEEFMKGRITGIGCPKLDGVDYAEKLTAILRENDIQSVTVLRMDVPCCDGLPRAVKTAVENSGKPLPLEIVTVSREGTLPDRR